jgi:hypothetical protein
MKASVLSTLLFSLAVTADVVPAIRRDAASVHLDARQPTNPLLGKRQFCDVNYPYICSAIDGDAMCMAPTEVCCQRIGVDGTFPYVCDDTHPYCCPSDENGIPQCGSDDTCGAGAFEAAPTHELATQTTGVAPTTQAAAKTVTQASAGGATKTAGGAKTPVKTNAADHVGMVKGGVAAAVFGVMAVL